MIKIIKLLIILFVFLLSLAGAIATPVSLGPYNTSQPDGTTFEARLVGNNEGEWIENLDGYTIGKDKDNWWTYTKEYGGK